MLQCVTVQTTQREGLSSVGYNGALVTFFPSSKSFSWPYIHRESGRGKIFQVLQTLGLGKHHECHDSLVKSFIFSSRPQRASFVTHIFENAFWHSRLAFIYEQFMRENPPHGFSRRYARFLWNFIQRIHFVWRLKKMFFSALPKQCVGITRNPEDLGQKTFTMSP